MDLTQLTALSPLDGRYRSKAEPLANIFSEYGLIEARVTVEVRWLQALAHNEGIEELPAFSDDTHAFLDKVVADFSLADAKRVKEIEQNTNHDVKAVEYFLQEKLISKVDLSDVQNFIHFACTSEDINNLAYGLMLKEARDTVVLPELSKLIDQLREMAHEFSPAAMLARTHGQPATPTTMGKEFANVVARLQRQYSLLHHQLFLGKMNGATGNYNAHACTYPHIDWPTFTERFIADLGLTQNEYTTQIEPHDYVAEYCHTSMRINTILIDFARDVWGYISMDYFGQVLVENEVGSSTMPHKINPIDFENAEGNFGLSNALFAHFADKLPISRFQRDLSDSTVLRNLGVAVGYAHTALLSLEKGLSKIKLNASTLESDLALQWSILAEALQTVMRRHGVKKPYELLKDLTRGKALTAAAIAEFIDSLSIPNEAKAELKTLTPNTYTGLAEQLSTNI